MVVVTREELIVLFDIWLAMDRQGFLYDWSHLEKSVGKSRKRSYYGMLSAC